MPRSSWSCRSSQSFPSKHLLSPCVSQIHFWTSSDSLWLFIRCWKKISALAIWTIFPGDRLHCSNDLHNTQPGESCLLHCNNNLINQSYWVALKKATIPRTEVWAWTKIVGWTRSAVQLAVHVSRAVAVQCVETFTAREAWQPTCFLILTFLWRMWKELSDLSAEEQLLETFYLTSEACGSIRGTKVTPLDLNWHQDLSKVAVLCGLDCQWWGLTLRTL